MYKYKGPGVEESRYLNDAKLVYGSVEGLGQCASTGFTPILFMRFLMFEKKNLKFQLLAIWSLIVSKE